MNYKKTLELAKTIIMDVYNVAPDTLNNVELLCSDVATFMKVGLKASIDDKMTYEMRKYATGTILSDYIIKSAKFYSDTDGVKSLGVKEIMVDMLIEIIRSESQLNGLPDEVEFEYGEKPSPAMNRNIVYDLLKKWLADPGM